MSAEDRGEAKTPFRALMDQMMQDQLTHEQERLLAAMAETTEATRQLSQKFSDHNPRLQFGVVGRAVGKSTYYAQQAAAQEAVAQLQKKIDEAKLKQDLEYVRKSLGVAPDVDL